MNEGLQLKDVEHGSMWKATGCLENVIKGGDEITQGRHYKIAGKISDPHADGVEVRSILDGPKILVPFDIFVANFERCERKSEVAKPEVLWRVEYDDAEYLAELKLWREAFVSVRFRDSKVSAERAAAYADSAVLEFRKRFRELKEEDDGESSEA